MWKVVCTNLLSCTIFIWVRHFFFRCAFYFNLKTINISFNVVRILHLNTGFCRIFGTSHSFNQHEMFCNNLIILIYVKCLSVCVCVCVVSNRPPIARFYYIIHFFLPMEFHWAFHSLNVRFSIIASLMQNEMWSFVWACRGRPHFLQSLISFEICSNRQRNVSAICNFKINKCSIEWRIEVKKKCNHRR